MVVSHGIGSEMRLRMCFFRIHKSSIGLLTIQHTLTRQINPSWKTFRQISHKNNVIAPATRDHLGIYLSKTSGVGRVVVPSETACF